MEFENPACVKEMTNMRYGGGEFKNHPVSCKNIETVICIWKVESLAPSFPISMYGTSSQRIKYLLLCSSCSGTSKCQRVCTAAALLPPTRLFYFSPSPDNENREDWTGGNVPHLDFQRLWTPCNLSAAPVRFRYQDHPVWMTLTNIIWYFWQPANWLDPPTEPSSRISTIPCTPSTFSTIFL